MTTTALAISDDAFRIACGIVTQAKSIKSVLRHRDVIDAFAAVIRTEREARQKAEAERDNRIVLFNEAREAVREEHALVVGLQSSLATATADIERLNRQLQHPRSGSVFQRVVAALPEGEFSVAEIKAQVEAPQKEIFNSLGFLRRKGTIERLGYGRYRRARSLLNGEKS